MAQIIINTEDATQTNAANCCRVVADLIEQGLCFGTLDAFGGVGESWSFTKKCKTSHNNV